MSHPKFLLVVLTRFLHHLLGLGLLQPFFLISITHVGHHDEIHRIYAICSLLVSPGEELVDVLKIRHLLFDVVVPMLCPLDDLNNSSLICKFLW